MLPSVIISTSVSLDVSLTCFEQEMALLRQVYAVER